MQSSAVGFGSFVRALRRIDGNTAKAFALVSESDDYDSTFSQIDNRTFSLQIVKAFLKRLGLAGLRNIQIDPENPRHGLKTRSTTWLLSGNDEFLFETVPDIVTSAESLWDRELEALREASARKGRGQHEVVADRLRQLVRLLDSAEDKTLGPSGWAWRSAGTRYGCLLHITFADFERLYAGWPPSSNLSSEVGPVRVSVA